MRKEIFYKCPVCGKVWEKESEAIACRKKHPAIKKRWFYCEVCGEGWNPDAYWGEKGAAEQALACERKHREKGEVEEVSRRVFFLTGGKQGKYYPIGGI